jgi:MscS family membrane protein
VYVSKIDQIKNFTENISEFIMKDSDFIVDANHKSFVRLEKFNDSSIDILIYCFTSTNDWDRCLKIKEKLALKIKTEIETIGLEFAFPSQSIYLKK